MASNRLVKRKRNQVSYAEPEDDSFDSAYESGDESAVNKIDNDLPEGDTVYGARRKPTKLRARKKLRFTRPRPKRPSKPFQFLSLPAELRDYIYQLSLTDDGGISLVSKTKGLRRTITRGLVYDTNGNIYQGHRLYGAPKSENVDGSQPPYNSLAPNLLAVNKQIHAEGLGYLYQQSITLQDTMALHTFLAAIGPTNRPQLTNLSIKSWGTGRGAHKAMNVAGLTALAGCTNLKVLDLDCRIGWGRQAQRVAQQLYRDGHYFFEAYGAANGKKDAAVEVLRLHSWNFGTDEWYSYDLADTIEAKVEFKRVFQAELRKLVGA